MSNKTILTKLGACPEAVEWASKYRSKQAAWAACKRGDWMLWFCGKKSGPVGDPSRRKLVGAAAACARLALPIWQKKYPKDDRVEKCLIACEGYALGTVSDAELAAAQDAAGAAAGAATGYAAGAAQDAAWAAAWAAWAARDAARDAARAAAWAAWAAQDAAGAAQDETLKRCADIVRSHYPEVPR